MVVPPTAATKGVLLILAVLSLVSWAIMLAKWVQFRRVERAGDGFMHDFTRATSFEQAADLTRGEAGLPHAQIMDRAREFINEVTPALGATAGRAAKFSGSQVEALRLVLDAETNAARDRLAHFLAALATIGSVSPLIGLFGTVLGVIEAFIGIASKGSGNIGATNVLRTTGRALGFATILAFARRLFARHHLDGSRARGRDSRGVRLQHLRQPPQPDRQRARRLRDGADRAARARGSDLAWPGADAVAASAWCSTRRSTS